MRRRQIAVSRATSNRTVAPVQRIAFFTSILFILFGGTSLFAWLSLSVGAPGEIEKKTQEEIRSIISGLPPDCPRARPTKFAKPDPSNIPKRGPKPLSPEQVSNFDIMGVRLYTPVRDIMTLAQGSKAFGSDPRVTLGECAADAIEFNRVWREWPSSKGSPPEERKSCIAGLFYAGAGKDDLSLSLDFVEDLPVHPGCMIVYQISLQEAGNVNSASRRAWDQALITKYGQPDLVGWGDPSGPSLRDMTATSVFFLILQDMKFKEEKEDAASQFIADAKPVVKPRL